MSMSMNLGQWDTAGFSGRPRKPSPALEPWKPEKAKNRSHSGRWLCDNCCRYQHGSKQDHKRLCQGFTLLRTSAK